MKKIELLAPAGGWDSLEAAVKAGADAVYLSGQQFGARKSAANFTVEEIKEAVTYTHLRSVKVYVTVNTLIADIEMADLFDYLDELYVMGVDAFIVQDHGVFLALHTRYPEIEIHCSTQMALHNAQDVLALQTAGASRVVVPREMSVGEIRKISESVAIELEAFVHGALCVCVSGQCLMSSMIGGRSGNRGSCAQSCRQKYTLKKDSGLTYQGKKGDYLLSPRDLCTLEELQTIVEAGVTSLKIEGRMKGPEYTYQVTKYYRDQLDNLYPELALQRKANQDSSLAAKSIGFLENKPPREVMAELFSRDFTKGYILGDQGEQLMSQVTPGNRGVEVAEVVSFDDRNKEVTLLLKAPLFKGDDIQLRTRKETVGGRVEYIVHSGARIDEAAEGMTVKINFKHETKKGDVFFRTYNAKLMKDIRDTLNETSRTVPIALTFSMAVGKSATLTVADFDGHRLEVVSEVQAEKALKMPLSKERIEEQLLKFGSTAYHVTSIEIETDGEATMPVKLLNQLRREAAEGLDQLRLSAGVRNAFNADLDPFEMTESATGETVSGPQQVQLVGAVGKLEQLEYLISEGFEILYYKDWKTLPQAVEMARNYNIKLFAAIGRQLDTAELEARVAQLGPIEDDLAGYLAASPGQIQLLKQFGKPVIADFTLNVFNRFGVLAAEQYGASILTLSPELNHDQIERLAEAWDQMHALEILGYGRIPVMVTKYCPINGTFGVPIEGCTLCRASDYSLVDKTGAEFPIKTDDDCLVEIYNSAILNIVDEIPECGRIGVSRYRLSFIDETIEEMGVILAWHRESLAGQIPELKGKGYTKGHFRRGVLGQ